MRSSNSERTRVLFVTREPLLNQVGGSSTYALNFIRWLTLQGCDVTVLATLASSRSPRLWLRLRGELPPSATLVLPGGMRFGNLQLLPLSPRAWVRGALRGLQRVSARHAGLRPLGNFLQRAFQGRVTDLAWDLTPPTHAEQQLVQHWAQRSAAQVLVGNYAYWGAIFAAPEWAAMPRVLLMHDLLSARVERFRLANMPFDCPDIDAATEYAWLNNATCVLAAQAQEADSIAAQVTAKIMVQPMVFSVQLAALQVEAGRVLLVGSNIPPNRNALQWFLDQVWPQIRTAAPHATLAVAGALAAAVPAVAPGVERTGVVDDLAAEYARAAVCIVPLRIGTGIKVKLVEALAYGKAVVSTSVGVEGLGEWVASTVTIADDPADFSNAVAALLSDTAQRQRAEHAAREAAATRFSASQQMTAEFAEAVLGRLLDTDRGMRAIS